MRPNGEAPILFQIAYCQGHSYVVTSHGKAVAKIVPVEKNGGVARGARTALVKRLRSEPVVTIGRWSRDELYEDKQ